MVSIIALRSVLRPSGTFKLITNIHSAFRFTVLSDVNQEDIWVSNLDYSGATRGTGHVLGSAVGTSLSQRQLQDH